MVNQDMKNNCLIVLISIIISACSAPDSSQGVVSTQDLSTDTTVTTIIEDVVEENLSSEDARSDDLSDAASIPDRIHDEFESSQPSNL